MTDPDRLRKIANAASHGMPPPSVEDMRYLLDQLRQTCEAICKMHAAKGEWPSVCNGAEIVIDACRYTVRKRCKACGGEGKITQEIVTATIGSGATPEMIAATIKRDGALHIAKVKRPDCSGTGYQEAAP